MELDDLPEELEPVEGYCLHCRETVEMDDPAAVWTRRGVPATRGTCPICGGVVFRMGKSAAHERQDAPESRPRLKLARETVYLDFALADAEIAARIAADLEQVGVACWQHETEPEGIPWASDVHPALSTCHRMIVLLSPAALRDPQVEAAWRYFRSKNKPIVLAQFGAAAPPDDLRRRPRFDFTGNYRSAFRQLLQALNDGK